MKKNLHLTNFYFLLALGLISLFAYTILFSAITYVRGYSMTAWQFPAAAIMMLITQYYASRELFAQNAKSIFLKCSAVLLSLILLSLVLANSIYDVSSDGQWYHQETVYQLKKGWNPYQRELNVPKIPGVWDPLKIWCVGPHETPKENPKGDQDVLYVKYISVNHFAKGVEIMEASIYALTNKIETGKAINILIMLASLFSCLSVFYLWDRWSTRKKWFIALTVTCNPVVVVQSVTYCLDGLMYSMILCLLAVFILILIEKNRYTFFLFGLLIMSLVNIKFTTVVFAAIFCIAFVVYLVVLKNWTLIKRICIAGSISFIVGFVFIGFHPYMTNLIMHNDIFYGLKETQEENYAIMPSFFRDRNRFLSFFASYGSSSYYQAGEGTSLKQVLKVPYTFTKKELKNADDPELQVAGFGPFFSGALIFCALLLTVMTIRNYKDPAYRLGVMALGVILFSIFIMPLPWWARFVPQVWLIPCLILLLSEYMSFQARFVKPILYFSLWLNIAWSFSGIFSYLLISSHIDYQMAQLKAQSGPIKVEYCGYIDLRSNGYRLAEHGISYEEQNVTGGHIYNVIHSTTRFETTEELPLLPEPILMRLGRKLNGSVSK